MDEAIKTHIVDQITEMMIRLAPDANLRAMYGGTVFELINDDPKSRIGGVYVYKDYVSLEFAKGASFDDQGGVLEGSGKLRRHVKLRSLAQIGTAGCEDFLNQAIAAV